MGDVFGGKTIYLKQNKVQKGYQNAEKSKIKLSFHFG
jgi:hypothetical protein